MMGFSKRSVLAALCLSFMGWGEAAFAQTPKCLLKENGKLAIIGDSITEQKVYSIFIETYLAVCHPELKQDVCQFGWGGDRAAGYLNRMDYDTLSWFKPDAATLCFGMNDGSYTLLTPAIAQNFETPSRKILEKFKAAGTETVLGGPGAVDTRYFNANKPSGTSPEVYNQNLAGLSAIAEKIAPQYGARFVPLHQTLRNVMAKAKAANGEDFDVCGRDGVHPGANGHLVMAYVFLKGLGVSGDIASLLFNYTDSTVTPSQGQKVLSVNGGVIELESTRYPFCFSGKPNEPNTASMLPYIPFNDDLNRFIFKVAGLPWSKAKVTWGNTSKTFTKEELEKGVNLAAAFAEANPLREPFSKVRDAVAKKQGFETVLIKSHITHLKPLEDDPDCKAAAEAFKAMLLKKRATLCKAVSEAVVPARSTLKVEPAG